MPFILARLSTPLLAVLRLSSPFVSAGELRFGALKSNNSKKTLDILEELAVYIPVLSMSVDVAKEYADIRADLAVKGMPIGNNDLWMAAHARTLGYTLVSINIKEFERVENLKLENWVSK